ncbi:MAG: hypothetical protein HRT86_07300 [Ilumatobacteraceae bacterium]|nr:hypothetical protein [Ilumatobacteraceae bacterium]
MTAWPKPGDKQYFDDVFATTAPRLHAIEWAWLATMTTTTIYRYRFDPARFRPWPEANGQWISDEAVEPVAGADQLSASRIRASSPGISDPAGW